MGGSAWALVALGTLPGRRGDWSPRFRSEPFTLGVGSGDPVKDGVVLWTRLEGEAVRDVAGNATRVPVRWEVAEDDGFRKIVKHGQTLALPELGWSVHAEVGGLKAGHDYHYRFIAGGVESPYGVTRTAPKATDRVKFAFASCQDYEDGYYTAYRHMAEEQPDFIVHLGDYIYEVASRPNTVRPHGQKETYTLDDYRRRHTIYRGDPDLQFAHATTPWIVTWDDHDVDNNYAGLIPEERDAQNETRKQFVLRRAAAYQAYYEFLPMRITSVPGRPEMPIFRRFAFGDLLSMHVIDSRQWRTDQPCGDRVKPTCDARMAPEQTMLGKEQEFWLDKGMRGSHARWNVLANQVMMAPLGYSRDDGVRMWSMDAWDGYPKARQRMLDLFADKRVSNPVVITGDIHASFVNDLHQDAERMESPVVATELIGTSITTGGDGRDVDEESDGMFHRNPWIKYYAERRGYVSCEVTAEKLTAKMQAVPVISSPDGKLDTLSTWVIESGRPGATRTDRGRST